VKDLTHSVKDVIVSLNEESRRAGDDNKFFIRTTIIVLVIVLCTAPFLTTPQVNEK